MILSTPTVCIVLVIINISIILHAHTTKLHTRTLSTMPESEFGHPIPSEYNKRTTIISANRKGDRGMKSMYFSCCFWQEIFLFVWLSLSLSPSLPPPLIRSCSKLTLIFSIQHQRSYTCMQLLKPPSMHATCPTVSNVLHLTLWRLTTLIGGHTAPLTSKVAFLHFIYLFDKYRYWIF